MSDSRLPSELFDHLVDLFHDQPETLKRCCLVSTSWVSRARKHLYSRIVFHSLTNLNAWKDAFPHPAASPACHVRSLSLHHVKIVTTLVQEEIGWIRAFSNVVRLTLQQGMRNLYLRSLLTGA